MAVAAKSDLRAKILQGNLNHEGARMGVAIKAAKRVVLRAMTVQRAVVAAARRTAVVLGAVLGVAHGAARRAVLRVALGAEKRVVLRAEKRAVIAAAQRNVRRVVLGAMIVIEVALAAETRVVPGAESRAAVGVEIRVAVGAEVQVHEAVQGGVPRVADAPTVAKARAVAVGVAVPVLEEEVAEAEARITIRKSGASCLSVALVEKEVRVLSAIQRTRSLPASGKCWETKCVTVAKIALEGLACSSILKVAKASRTTIRMKNDCA